MKKHIRKYITFSCRFIDGPSEKAQRHHLNIEHPKINQALTVIGPGNEKERNVPKDPDDSN